MGIRLALGAPGEAIVRGLAARGAVFVAIGIAAGVAGALAGSRVMSSLLFQVDPRDPLTIAGVAVAIGGVALLSTVLPTVRATRIDPVTVLRQ